MIEFKRTFVMREGIRVPVTIYPKCEQCKHDIVSQKKVVSHINNTDTHLFCSKKCREAWCYQQHAK